MLQIDELLETRVKFFEKVDDECLPLFRGHFLKIVTSQNGSRVLQRALAKTHKSIISIMFTEIEPYLHELMTDSYANYFCQKFYEFLEFHERIAFLHRVN